MDDLLVIARANYEALLMDDDLWVKDRRATIQKANPLWYSDLWIGRRNPKRV